ncbi:MAG TPA: glutamine synthetase adenylyltransferase [Thermoanaerobaculia bacterium]|nr:glutamine synthetase adenylyltransferase [Thermoanaerobaculia bacterium]
MTPSAPGRAQPEDAPGSRPQRAVERLLALPPLHPLGDSLRDELARVADPERAAVSLERLIAGSRDPESLISAHLGGPRRRQNVLAIFGASQYLTEIVLRRPNLLEEISTLHRSARVCSAAELRGEIDDEIGFGLGEGRSSADGRSLLVGQALVAALDALRRVHQRAILHIGAADLLALFDLPTLTAQLSTLADVMVDASLSLARLSLPEDERPATPFAVLAFGKLGGGELNYSSDIDLVYVAADDAPSCWPLGRRLTDHIKRATAHGFLYRVDLRLRPWGRDGPLVQSVDSYLDYLGESAHASERQALIKARPIAGDLELGARLLHDAGPLIYRGDDPESLRGSVRSLKERIEEELRKRGQEWGQVKAGEGSIRDVEFVTQYLQLVHVPRHPAHAGLRSTSTLGALDALLELEEISEKDYRDLVQGYVFLRTVEHDLQLVSNQPIHRLPEDPGRLRHVAHRLGFGGPRGTERFLRRYREHSATIREVWRRTLEQIRTEDEEPDQEAPDRIVMPAPYRQAFGPEDVARHERMAALLDEQRHTVVEVRRSGDSTYRVELVGHDALGSLSILCGLLYVYGFTILDGQVFTSLGDAESREPAPVRRRIVDVFHVRSTAEQPSAQDLDRFEQELVALIGRLHQGGHREVQTELAKRISLGLSPGGGATRIEPHALLPIDIRVDNERSAAHTVLEIEAPDTVGFLYELTNALALSEVNVELMEVRTSGQRARDTLWVTDARGGKILAEAQVRKLRVATVLTKHFTHLLPSSADPERALLHFRQFLGDLFARPDWERDISSLEQPAVLSGLAQLLGVSDFLWHDFLRMQHETLFPVMTAIEELQEARPRRELVALFDAELDAHAAADRAAILNRIKDREMFRIDMRHILRHGSSFDQFSRELTELAEVLAGRALELADSDLVERHGQPLDEEGRVVPHALCALGKFGGWELGFASDLELLLIYGGDGRCREDGLFASEFFSRLVERLRSTIATRKEGIFELDLRLRPYGDGGPLAVSLAAFESYFAPEGDAWPYERQGLVKLRPFAGDLALGARTVALRDRLVYESWSGDVAASRAMRERQVRHLVTPGTLNAKFSPGCLVDLEYVVQLLQIRHGGERPALRSPNVLAAIGELHAAGILDARDYDTLAGSYRFYRRLIDALRMVRGHAKDLTVPPVDSDEFRFLARRFGEPSERLAATLDRMLTQVPRLAERLLDEAGDE